ncbi:ribosome-binding factor A [Candidatus Azambacteria bacterium]|nr:ribosome-binding factor A [Candidatus Azambacteria bacterium]
MTDRIEKINELLRQEVGKLILKESDFPVGILVTVSRAIASPNLKNATIYITTLPENVGKDIINELEMKIYDIQKSLNRRLNMKPVPKIEFKIDKQAYAEQKIYELLNKNKGKE